MYPSNSFSVTELSGPTTCPVVGGVTSSQFHFGDFPGPCSVLTPGKETERRNAVPRCPVSQGFHSAESSKNNGKLFINPKFVK